MILTRIWFSVCALVAAVGLYLAVSASANHAERERDLATEQVRIDQRGVQLALRIDARQRLDLLLRFSGDKALRDATRAAQGKPGATAAAQKSLADLAAKVPAEYKFSALFLVDREGRVVGRSGYDTAAAYPDMELGGYAAVFDALHGFARDDAWSWGSHVFRVVARPIEDEVGAPPMGAVVGLTEIDRVWARDLARRTGANVVFTAKDRAQKRSVAFGSASDLSEAEISLESAARHEDTERLLGEAGEDNNVVVTCVRFAGSAGALAALSGAKLLLPGAMLALLLGVAMLALYMENDRPFSKFAAELARVAEGRSETLGLASLTGRFRGLGDLVNRAVETLAARGGVRPAVDLGALVGSPDARAGMSAFSLPDAPSSSNVLAGAIMPPPRVVPPAARAPMPKARASPPQLEEPAFREDEITGVNLQPQNAPAAASVADDRSVYEAFLQLRAQCGEASDSLTFDSFSRVLAKHRADIGGRYPRSNVAFSVYVKEGKASLRATPVKAAGAMSGKEERQ